MLYGGSLEDPTVYERGRVTDNQTPNLQSRFLGRFLNPDVERLGSKVSKTASYEGGAGYPILWGGIDIKK